jgi:hypothetical protein
MKYKLLIIFPYFGYTLKTKCRNMAIFIKKVSLLVIGKPKRSFDFEFCFLAKFCPKKKGCLGHMWNIKSNGIMLFSFMEFNLEGKHSFPPG